MPIPYFNSVEGNYQLKISNEQTVIIIDDDEAIHDIWRERIRHFCDQHSLTVQLLHFHSPQSLAAWQESDVVHNGNIVYLCDDDFVGSAESGLQLITRLQLTYMTVLVTSRFYLDEVISSCESYGIKLLPKDMAGIVPIIKCIG